VQKSLQITAITTLYVSSAHIHLKRGKAGGQLFARRRLALGIKSTFFIRFTYHYSPQQLGHEFDVSHFFPQRQLLSHSSEYIERAVSFFTLISSALDWQTAAPLERAALVLLFCVQMSAVGGGVCVAVAATESTRRMDRRRENTNQMSVALAQFTHLRHSTPTAVDRLAGWLTSHTLDSIK